MSTRRLLAAATFATVLAAGAPAQADKAAAESLYLEGKAALDAGRVDEACPKLAESLRLDPAVGTLLNLARCHQQQGKTATAWAEYREAAVMAERSSQTERAEGARRLAAELEPTLPHLRIHAQSPTQGLVVRLDGEVLGAGVLGARIAVDPGGHRIEAEAPGHRPWSAEIALRTASDDHTVTIPPLVPTPRDRSTPAPPAFDRRTGSDGTLRTVGFVVGGVGLAGVAVGTVFGALTFAAASDAESDPALCPDRLCTREGDQAIDAASTKGVVSTIAFAVGGAALATGMVLVIIGGPERGSGATARHVDVVATPGGASLRGAF